MRAWWSDAAKAAIEAGPVDGVFADALLQVIAPDKRELLGDEKYEAINEGLIEMLKETRRKIGPDKIILCNSLREGRGGRFLPTTSGAMIEHFDHFNSTAKEAMAADIEQAIAAGKAGKIVVLKAWPGFSVLDKAMMEKPHDELARLARERLTFPLACFLVAAQPQSYLCYTWGYRDCDGTFEWYPQFDKPLGPPIGQAVRDGWTFTRRFQHAAVRADLETKTAKIEW